MTHVGDIKYNTTLVFIPVIIMIMVGMHYFLVQLHLAAQLYLYLVLLIFSLYCEGGVGRSVHVIVTAYDLISRYNKNLFGRNN